MKIVIYSVAEKTPPINELLIKWSIDEDGEINGMEHVKAEIAIPDEDDLPFLSPDIHKMPYLMKMICHFSVQTSIKCLNGIMDMICILMICGHIQLPKKEFNENKSPHAQ